MKLEPLDGETYMEHRQMLKDTLTDDHNTLHYKFIWYSVVRISNSIEASTVVQNDKFSI